MGCISNTFFTFSWFSHCGPFHKDGINELYFKLIKIRLPLKQEEEKKVRDAADLEPVLGMCSEWATNQSQGTMPKHFTPWSNFSQCTCMQFLVAENPEETHTEPGRISKTLIMA